MLQEGGARGIPGRQKRKEELDEDNRSPGYVTMRSSGILRYAG